MQIDYNSGHKFIGYVITSVRLRPEKYIKDNDLRYFEHIAIIKFNSTDPQKGYNLKKDTGQNMLNEESTIIWAQREFDSFSNPLHYGYMQEPAQRRRERNEFIDKCLR